MRAFEYFLEEGIVNRQTSNLQRTLSLLLEADEKKEFLETALKNIPPAEIKANFVVDYCYDIIMELLRAKMFLDGFNSGNSHYAEVSYLKKLGFPESQVVFMNEIRYFRNGTKYYGTILTKEYAQKVLEFMNKIHPQLKKLFLNLEKRQKGK